MAHRVNGWTPEEATEKELQAVAILKDNPGISCQELGERIGCCKTWAWVLKQRIVKSDWVQSAREEVKRLLGLALEAQEDALQAPSPIEVRRRASSDMFRGLGVYVDKKELQLSGDLKTIADEPPEMQAAIADEIRRMRAAREAAQADAAGDTEAPDDEG